MSTRIINLTKGKQSIISSEDFEYITGIGKFVTSSKNYAIHRWTDQEGKKRIAYLHRLVMAKMIGSPIPRHLTVDHIDRDRLNCTRSNLRLATKSEQQANKGNQINSSTSKGVHFYNGKYRVKIRFCGKRLSLGSYTNLSDALMVYGSAHRQLWGCFTTEAHIETTDEIEEYVRQKISHYGINVTSKNN